MVLDNIFHYGDPALRVSMLSRIARTDYLRQAEELAHFAQSTEIEIRGKQLGREVVHFVHERRQDNCKCLHRGETGHLKVVCPERKKNGEKGETDFELVVKDAVSSEKRLNSRQ